ncbi:GPW/gp25 family protein [Dyadobacter arcticus]|uniref:Phage baseplate assembly protein W n=1 Tax=Dyadobacter arcticus TaxID=1078754 RepID=A0ABX0UEQ1_9BACT|nr:GPW/gp25 family protein [Dyadobacter arcticus]NIJ51142.1 phage baseplate assembly protein W [Dyadobacter arcticus]
MEDQNYALPLALDRIVAGQIHPKSPDKEAIHQHLYLLMVTHFDEARFDSNYGCALWEHDFAVLSQIKWKDLIRESLEEAISKYEPRLTNAKIRIEVEEFEVLTKTNNYVRKRVGVEVKATIRRTNEPFLFFERIFISPLSIE